MATTNACSFVNLTTSTSKEERLRNRYLIRARTVKNNRRNQLLRTSREQENYSTRKNAGPARPLLPARSRPLPSIETKEESAVVTKTTASNASDVPGQIEFAPIQSADTQKADASPILALPATLSPFFGGLATDAFDSSSHSKATEISTLVFNILLSRVFIPSEITAYWTAFCQNPLIHYSYAHLHLFVNDNVHNAIDSREKARMYSLNIKISSMLQEMLPTLLNEDVEPVLLAMTLMAKHRKDADVKALSTQSTLFTPYKLYADLLEAFQAGHIESFVPAVRTLVTRIGGLHRLKTPGLSKMIRMNSLVQAALNCDPPYFDNCWNTHRLLATQGPIWDFLSSESSIPGIGFRTLVPGGLPPAALAACMNLSTTDRLLDAHRPQEISVKEFHLLTSARASVQHQLLALPAWSDIDLVDRGLSSPFLYECVRNAALLYCNAVIRPVLPGSKGIQEPLRRLRQQLECVDVSGSAWGAECSTVMLWCFVMGSLGSFSTPHWWYFLALLEEYLDRFGIGGRGKLVEIVRPFVWSESACGQGLEIVWGVIYGQCVVPGGGWEGWW